MNIILQEHPYSQRETLCLPQSCELVVRRQKNGNIDCYMFVTLDPYSDGTLIIDKETASAMITLLSKFVEEKQ